MLVAHDHTYAFASIAMATVSSGAVGRRRDGPAGGPEEGDGAGVLGQNRGAELHDPLSASSASKPAQEPRADSSTLVVVSHLDGELGTARVLLRAEPVGGGDEAAAIERPDRLVAVMVDVREVLEGRVRHPLDRCHEPQEARPRRESVVEVREPVEVGRLERTEVEARRGAAFG